MRWQGRMADDVRASRAMVAKAEQLADEVAHREPEPAEPEDADPSTVEDEGA